MTPKNDFKVLSDIEHVLLRPQIYISSVQSQSRKIFIDSQYEEIEYNPGLFKILNELIDNSLDEYIRTDGKFANQIDIKISDKTFSVKDNGRGIPVEYINDLDGTQLYRPVAAWLRTKAGSNFNDDLSRVTAGMNGVGSALSNIFSLSFKGETSDGKNKLTLICKNNAEIETINVKKSKDNYTYVEIEPDFKRFECENFDESIVRLLKDRIFNLAISYPKIKFTFNGELVESISPEDYIKKFNEDAVIYKTDDFILGVMPSNSGEFRAHSVMNGLVLYNNGNHVDYIINNICSKIKSAIEKKTKIKDIKPSQLKKNFELVSIINNFQNMKFDTQTKEKITNTLSEIESQLKNVDFDKIGKLILKSPTIIETIQTNLSNKLQEEEDLNAHKIQKKLKGFKAAKHIPANGKDLSKNYLFIAEGDSAISNFMAARDDKTQGAFPLRGKVLNTYGLSNLKILANEELFELMGILGLKLGHKAVDLNYGHIVIMTDQDVDGGSIQTLLVNFFYRWPELFEQGRILILNTPLYILRSKKDKKYFYSKEEFDAYKGSRKGYDVGYIKGLGSLILDEYEYSLQHPKFDVVKIDDINYLSMMFGDSADVRKDFMMSNHKDLIDSENNASKSNKKNGDKKEISLSYLAKSKWLEHAIYVLENRAIPSLVDGLKPVQRLILYSTMKNAKDKFSKIAEIASSISSYGYHHGESAAQDAASMMGAEWANNKCIIEGQGGFGTRLIQKASAARYIFAKLHDNYNILFKDENIAPEHPDEDHIPPKFYLPIIPFILVNGIKGIATGFATRILPYDPNEIAKLCKDYINGKNIDKRELMPSFPEFRGTVERKTETSYDVIGSFVLKSPTKLEITEIPYQYNRETYIGILDDLKENGDIVSYIEESKTQFKFIITLKRGMNYTNEKIEKMFKLRTPVTENITVIDQFGKPKYYETPINLIKDFCDYRIIFVQQRIDLEIEEATAKIFFSQEKIRFINLVLNNKMKFKEKTKSQLIDDLLALKFHENHLDLLLNMNFYHLTLEEIKKLESKILDLNERLSYLKTTTKEKEYLLDIETVIKK